MGRHPQPGDKVTHRTSGLTGGIVISVYRGVTKVMWRDGSVSHLMTGDLYGEKKGWTRWLLHLTFGIAIPAVIVAVVAILRAAK